MLRAHLLGGLALAWDDDPLPTIPGALTRSLFAYLVTYRERPHTRDLLIGMFWPDLPEITARRRLSQALWLIRRAFRFAPDAHGPSGQYKPQVLTMEDDTVQLNPDLPLWLDVEEFTRHWAQGMSREAGATEHCESCIEQYQGEFLAGYYDDWVMLERERLRGMLLEVLECLLEEYKIQSEYKRALVIARRLTMEDPWREQAHREVMRLCHLLGQDAEALKQYEVCRQTLAEELGVEPSPGTTALANEIAIRSELPRPPVLPSAARPVMAPLLERPDRLPLVGRQAELGELLHQMEAAMQGHGGLTIVCGEMGIGKSRLLRELAENALWRGVSPVWGRSYELAAPLAYQPLIEVFRARLPVLSQSALEPLWRAELSRLLPELATGEASLPSLPPQEERRRLLEAIAQAFLSLGKTGPHLVLLEDLQWMDPASLEALRYLLLRVGDAPLLVVVSVRVEELVGQTAEQVLALESTCLPRRLELGRLNLAETGELIQRALDLEQPVPLFSARLHAETEGNPFFLVETLQMLVDDGLLYRDEAGDWSTPWDESTDDYAELPLPAGVAQSIERRLERLPDRLNQTLNLAAVIGREVSFGLWLSASGWDEEALLAAGDALCARGLLLAAEIGSDGVDYIFAHDQIRRVAHERLAAPRRRLYHRRVAEALSELAPGEPVALAYHWTQAEEWDKAADCHQQAGERAWAVYATASALGHYTQALQALERLPGSVDLARKVQLLLAREAVFDLLGEREAQAKDLQVLEKLVEDLDDDLQRAKVALRRSHHAGITGNFSLTIRVAQQAIRLARMAQDVDIQAEGYLNWGRALCEQADYETARTRLETSLDLARAARLPAIEADVLRVLYSISNSTGDYESALTFGEQALRMYRDLGDRLGEGRMFANLGIVSDYQGDYTRARAYYEQALDIFRLASYRRGEGMVLANLGILARYQGAYAQARAYYEQALPIYRTVGDRKGEANSLTLLGNISLDQREYAGAETYLQQALQIYREIGERYGEGFPLHSLGDAARQQGDYAAARRFLEMSLHIRCEIDDQLGEGSTLQTLGVLSRCLGDYAQARVYLERSLHIFCEIGARQNEGACLSELSLLFHLLQDDQAARTYSQRALAAAQDVGDRPTQGRALTNLGHALMGLGHLAEAAAAYQEALDLQRELGEHHFAVESQAGLARLYLAQCDLLQAREQVGEILAYLDAEPSLTNIGHSLDGTEEPLWVYLTCYQVLRANKDPRTQEVLTTAYDLLQERAAKIDDEALRRSFLENVPSHREIVAARRELWASQQEKWPLGEKRVTIPLPRADAPLGRPLRKDEYATVTWTLQAPGDTKVSGKVARRRHRILRLLSEAQAQGAVPTHRHLAEALGVSQRTIERDMAMLHREHPHHPPTRGKMSE